MLCVPTFLLLWRFSEYKLHLHIAPAEPTINHFNPCLCCCTSNRISFSCMYFFVAVIWLFCMLLSIPHFMKLLTIDFLTGLCPYTATTRLKSYCSHHQKFNAVHHVLNCQFLPQWLIINDIQLSPAHSSKVFQLNSTRKYSTNSDPLFYQAFYTASS